MLFRSDKPDIRFGLEIVDVTSVVANSDFKVFTDAAKTGTVRAINATKCGGYSRKEIDELGQFVAKYGAKGLAWIVVEEGGLRSPIAKFLSPEITADILSTLSAKAGDLLLFVADKPKVALQSLGALRLHLADKLGLRRKGEFKFLWVVEFPQIGRASCRERV